MAEDIDVPWFVCECGAEKYNARFGLKMSVRSTYYLSELRISMYR